MMVGMCFLLGACGAEDPEDLFGSAEGSDEKSSQGGEGVLEESVEGNGQAVLAAEAGYQYGNMQKNVPPGDYMRYEDEIVFHKVCDGQILLFTYDMETGEVSTFSKDATDIRSITTYGNLEVYDGELYMQSVSNKITKLADGEAERVVDGNVNGFWHANGDLYAVTKDSSLIMFEEGSTEAKTLIDEYSSYWNVIFGQYLYGQSSNGLTRVDLSAEELKEETLLEHVTGIIDGEHIYYADEADDFRFYRCDMDGSNPVLLLDNPVLPASMNFDDTYFYFRLFTDLNVSEGEDCCDVYRFPKEDPAQIKKIATLPVPVFNIYTVPGYDKIFVTTMTDGFQTYVMGLDGSDPTPLALPDF